MQCESCEGNGCPECDNLGFFCDGCELPCEETESGFCEECEISMPEVTENQKEGDFYVIANAYSYA